MTNLRDVREGVETKGIAIAIREYLGFQGPFTDKHEVWSRATDEAADGKS